MPTASIVYHVIGEAKSNVVFIGGIILKLYHKFIIFMVTALAVGIIFVSILGHNIEAIYFVAASTACLIIVTILVDLNRIRSVMMVNIASSIIFAGCWVYVALKVGEIIK
jgi:hypothetical protein